MCFLHLLDALKSGYRLIDTAQSYFNEEEVGSAIKKNEVIKAIADKYGKTVENFNIFDFTLTEKDMLSKQQRRVKSI